MPIADDERALFDWASKQTYIALGNMLTGAAMLGIDSCAIEGMEYAAVEKILAEAGLLDPEHYGLSVSARLFCAGKTRGRRPKSYLYTIKFSRRPRPSATGLARRIAELAGSRASQGRRG